MATAPTVPARPHPTPAGRAPAARTRSPRRLRTTMRWLHIVVGLLLGTYVYLPTYVPGQPLLHLFLMVVGVPLVTLSGIVLWKQAALRRLVTRVRARR